MNKFEEGELFSHRLFDFNLRKKNIHNKSIKISLDYSQIKINSKKQTPSSHASDINSNSFSHLPILLKQPENIYIREVEKKKKEMELHKVQNIKQEKDLMKIRQHELSEKLQKSMSTVDISGQLKLKEKRMLKAIKDKKNPYSNKWIEIFLKRAYNSSMIMHGFLNGIPKYDIVKRNKGKIAYIENSLKKMKVKEEIEEGDIRNKLKYHILKMSNSQGEKKRSISVSKEITNINYYEIYKFFPHSKKEYDNSILKKRILIQ